MNMILVGVMGPGEGASALEKESAFELGQLIAREGWVLVGGGRNEGVMEAASRGAKSGRGLTVGILPSSDCEGASEAVDIPVVTGMGQARNNINVLSSRVVIVCGMNAGTASEVALAIKAERPVILLGPSDLSVAFFQSLDSAARIFAAYSPREAVALAATLLHD